MLILDLGDVMFNYNKRLQNPGEVLKILSIQVNGIDEILNLVSATPDTSVDKSDINAIDSEY